METLIDICSKCGSINIAYQYTDHNGIEHHKCLDCGHKEEWDTEEGCLLFTEGEYHG